MSKITFVNPYDEDVTMTKTINPNGKGYKEKRDGGFTFEFTACSGRHFSLEKFPNGTYKFMTAYHPEDPFDWREYDKEDFSVVE